MTGMVARDGMRRIGLDDPGIARDPGTVKMDGEPGPRGGGKRKVGCSSRPGDPHAAWRVLVTAHRSICIFLCGLTGTGRSSKLTESANRPKRRFPFGAPHRRDDSYSAHFCVYPGEGGRGDQPQIIRNSRLAYMNGDRRLTTDGVYVASAIAFAIPPNLLRHRQVFKILATRPNAGRNSQLIQGVF